MSECAFFEVTGPKYLEEMERRLHNTDLVWIKQARRIVEPLIGSAPKILDIGCGVGYLFNYFRDLAPSYVGLDGEERLLDIGRKFFAGENKVRLVRHDIAQTPVPAEVCPRADLVLCSATLEHLSAPFQALQHMADATGKVLYLRTFMGETTQLYSLPSPVPEFSRTHRKIVNRFAFEDILKPLGEWGFRAKIYRDEYTDSMPYLIDGTVRSFFVVVAVRN